MADPFEPMSDEELAAWASETDPEPLEVCTPPESTATLQHPPAIATEPKILDLFASNLTRTGVVGEERAAKLLYLVLTSRLLEQPVSAVVKGPSAGGKSYVVDQVVKSFPPSATYVLSAMSERALAYSKEPLSHRVLVLYEAVALQSDFASYLVRSLLSEGCVRYETVEKTKAGIEARLIHREGPTGLIVTTTALRLHPENETRMMSVPINDTPAQTRLVLLHLAQGQHGAVDLTEWHGLQAWLEANEHRVSIPYAGKLADLIPPVAVRLRRDFGAVLNLIKANAILHQLSRSRDPDGRVVASLEDYEVVRELVVDLVAEGVEATVSETIRETVSAVEVLAERHSEGVPITALAQMMKLDKSVVSRRARAARDRGYLDNTETRKGRPARLVIGEPLPEELEVLPPAAVLQCCSVDGGDIPPATGCPTADEVLALAESRGWGRVVFNKDHDWGCGGTKEQWRSAVDSATPKGLAHMHQILEALEGPV